MGQLDNCARMIYLSPNAVDFYPDWEKAARAKTAQLRTAVAADPDDPYLRDLVAELTAHSADFRRIWALHEVQVRGNEVKELLHPRLGELTLSWEVLSVSGTGQKFISMAGEPGSSLGKGPAGTGGRARRSGSPVAEPLKTPDAAFSE